MALRFFNLCNFIAIYVVYYVYIFVHAAKIKWTFVLPIACVESMGVGPCKEGGSELHRQIDR